MTGKEIALDQLLTFLVGLIFGIGLLVSGMVRRTNIIGFLGIGHNWNPSLLFVLGVGVLINLIFFTYMIKIRYSFVYIEKDLFWETNFSIQQTTKLIVSFY